MNVYIFQAALLCESCGETERASLIELGAAPEDPTDETSFDSDDFPKGPMGEGGGEADCPQHCDHCGVFLENPLTTDGREYVREAIANDRANRETETVALTEWEPFYDLD
jgi:hypothetical protein